MIRHDLNGFSWSFEIVPALISKAKFNLPIAGNQGLESGFIQPGQWINLLRQTLWNERV